MPTADQVEMNNLPTIVTQLLMNDLTAIKHLLTLLQQEKDAIETRQRDTLSNIVNEKTKCLNRIEQQSNERHNLLTSIGKLPTEESWQQLIAEIENEQLHDTWQIFIETLTECQHFNEVNGRLINRGQQTLHYLITVLRGQLNPPNLYNQRGATETHQVGHTVTRA